MKTTVDYSGLSVSEKEAAALRDVKEYIGADKFLSAVNLFRKEYPTGMEHDEFANVCGLFLGIEGFPVRAFHAHIWPRFGLAAPAY